MYRRAFSTLGCGELGLSDVLGIAERHDIPLVEVRALGGRIDLPAFLHETYGTPTALAERLKEAPANIVSFDTSFCLLTGGEEDRAALLEFVPWAEALGVRWLRVFDGGRTLDAPSLKTASTTLEWWQARRRRENIAVDLMIETHDVLVDSDNLHRFRRAMPPGAVWWLWDAHHTWRRGGEDPLVTWNALRDEVVHVHVKDSVGPAPRDQPANYVLPGSGDFPMAALRTVLGREFDGAVSLEWERLWQPHLAPLEEVLTAAAAHRWW